MGKLQLVVEGVRDHLGVGGYTLSVGLEKGLREKIWVTAVQRNTENQTGPETYSVTEFPHNRDQGRLIDSKLSADAAHSLAKRLVEEKRVEYAETWGMH